MRLIEHIGQIQNFTRTPTDSCTSPVESPYYVSLCYLSLHPNILGRIEREHDSPQNLLYPTIRSQAKDQLSPLETQHIALLHHHPSLFAAQLPVPGSSVNTMRSSPSPPRHSRSCTRTRTRSHSPHHLDTREYRSRSRSRSRSRHRHRRRHRHRHTATTTTITTTTVPPPPRELPFGARRLTKGDFNEYRAVFALYLDIQKQLVLEDLSSEEVRGRWKSFVGRWYVRVGRVSFYACGGDDGLHLFSLSHTYAHVSGPCMMVSCLLFREYGN